MFSSGVIMEERLKNGEKVLIFRNVSDIYEQSENDFIMGTIIYSYKSKNLTYKKDPFYVWIYKVIGDDGKEYECANGMIIYGTDYMMRPIDYLKKIKNILLDNHHEIERLEEINKRLVKTISSLNNIVKK